MPVYCLEIGHGGFLSHLQFTVRGRKKDWMRPNFFLCSYLSFLLLSICISYCSPYVSPPPCFHILFLSCKSALCYLRYSVSKYPLKKTIRFISRSFSRWYAMLLLQIGRKRWTVLSLCVWFECNWRNQFTTEGLSFYLVFAHRLIHLMWWGDDHRLCT
jgi:hypothetical protein